MKTTKMKYNVSKSWGTAKAGFLGKSTALNAHIRKEKRTATGASILTLREKKNTLKENSRAEVRLKPWKPRRDVAHAGLWATVGALWF